MNLVLSIAASFALAPISSFIIPESLKERRWLRLPESQRPGAKTLFFLSKTQFYGIADDSRRSTPINRERPWTCLPKSRRYPKSLLTKKNLEDEENEFPVGPEKSQMTNYILEYLKNTAQEEEEAPFSQQDCPDLVPKHTHLVAIPMHECHELMLELESVQRAILYHCPILVHACIPQITTRLPLLYVTAFDNSATSTERLLDIVSDEVRKTLLPLTSENESEDSPHNTPLMLHFLSLDIDGSQNEVLHTVANDKNALRLRKMVENLQHRIHSETGWITELPPDPNSQFFRPRVPFMRLPTNWEDIMYEEHGSRFEEGILTSDEGGNGISPIHWFKWEKDDFGFARMREVAIYQAIEKYDGFYDEKAFYFPSQSIELPMGGEELTKKEIKFRDYQNQRTLEAEQYFKTSGGPKDESTAYIQDDIVSTMTRNRLESLFEASTEMSEGIEQIVEQVDRSSGPPKGQTEPNEIEDWTRTRIRELISSREKVKSKETLSRKIEKPPLEENEVFAKYKNGTLVPKTERTSTKKKLPPFPSREYCCGFWRVLSSPTGFMVNEVDSSFSENLILRVDGTTAGGPVLDEERKQKASGGTWRFFEGSTLQDASMLIRLVIPPKKERVLVMEGRLERSSLGDLPLAGSSFGIPQVEERKAKSATEMEDLVYCIGNVWIEDAVTKANRREIGTFTLMKINVSRTPDSYTITVPRPVRNQD